MKRSYIKPLLVVEDIIKTEVICSSGEKINGQVVGWDNISDDDKFTWIW